MKRQMRLRNFMVRYTDGIYQPSLTYQNLFTGRKAGRSGGMKAAALVLLLAAGCVEGPCEKKYGTCPSDLPEDQLDVWRGTNLQSTVSLDPALSTPETQVLLAAGETWGAATGGKVAVIFVVTAGELPQHHVARRALPGELRPGELASTSSTKLRFLIWAGLSKFSPQRRE